MALEIPTREQVHSRLASLGHGRVEAVDTLARRGPSDFIGVTLLLAIGLRETWLRNIVGDGGHGRGWLQIDDRSHQDWLARRAGCRSGRWEFARDHRAVEPGYVPGLTAAGAYAIDLLHGNHHYGARHGVRAGHARDRFAVAAYNCGAGNALAAYRAGDVDGRTAGRDYSAWVFAVKPIVAGELHRLGWQ